MTDVFYTSGLAVNTLPTAVASHADANTKGASVELVASTSVACTGFWLWLSSANGASGYNMLADVMTGASLDNVLISNLFLGADQYGWSYWSNKWYIPIAIPQGTRVGLRCANTTGGKNMQASISYFKSSLGYGPQVSGVGSPISVAGVSPKAITTMTPYGINEAATAPTNNVDPGGTAHTKGSYVLIGTLSAACCALQFAFGPNQTSKVYTTAQWRMDVATGDAGSESIVVPNIPLRPQTTGMLENTPIIPIALESGTKISVRLQCSVNTANTRTLDVCCYAFS